MFPTATGTSYALPSSHPCCPPCSPQPKCRSSKRLLAVPDAKSSPSHGRSSIFPWATPRTSQSKLWTTPHFRSTGTLYIPVSHPVSSPIDARASDDLSLGIALYYGQLGLNCLWSPLFFGNRQARICHLNQSQPIPNVLFISHRWASRWLTACF